MRCGAGRQRFVKSPAEPPGGRCRSQNGPERTQSRRASTGPARQQDVKRRRACSGHRRRDVASRARPARRASAQSGVTVDDAGASPASWTVVRLRTGDGLQEAVAAFAGGMLVGCDERLLRPARQHVGDVDGRRGRGHCRRSRPLELESSSEAGKPPEQHLLVGARRSWLHCSARGKRLLSRGGRVAARFGVRGSDRPGARRSPWSQARPGVRRPARAPAAGRRGESRCARRRARFLVEHERRRRRGGPVHEQLHGLVAKELLGLDRVLGIGDVQRRDAEDDLARRAKRLAAGRQNRDLGAGSQDVAASALAAARRCSQLSRTSSSERAARNSTTACASSCPGRAWSSSAAAIASGICCACVSAASSTSTAPSGRDGALAEASSSASRVLPVPPVPASVSRRVFGQAAL